MLFSAVFVGAILAIFFLFYGFFTPFLVITLFKLLKNDLFGIFLTKKTVEQPLLFNNIIHFLINYNILTKFQPIYGFQFINSRWEAKLSIKSGGQALSLLKSLTGGAVLSYF